MIGYSQVQRCRACGFTSDRIIPAQRKRQAVLLVGVDHFLAKPYTAGILLKDLRAVLDEG